MPALAFNSALAPALAAMPTAVAVAVLCAAVIIEIVVVPAVLLPGGTVTLLAGALIGTGRPALAVALPVIAAVMAGDQMAYFGGSVVAGWWRRRRPGPAGELTARPGRAAGWLTAAMPSVAGGAGIHYPSFVVRVAVMRVPWLAAALSTGTLAARSLAGIGHVAGITGIAASAIVIACLLAARHGSGLMRALARCKAVCRRSGSLPGLPRQRAWSLGGSVIAHDAQPALPPGSPHDGGHSRG
jgi:membrane protein DedA with SNARE-associated domain